MTARRRSRVISGRWIPALSLVLITTLFGAARAMEPEPTRTAGFFSEVGAVLTVGLLVLASGRCTAAASRIVGTGRLRRTTVIRKVVRTATIAITEAASVVVLTLPVLASAWSYGGSRDQLLHMSIVLVSALTLGCLFGIFSGTMNIPPELGISLSVSSGALILWPGALGWIAEMHLAVLVLAMFAAAVGIMVRLYSTPRGGMNG